MNAAALPIEPVDAADAEAIGAFMVDVIAHSVTTLEPTYSELVVNVGDNLAWALANPASCVHLKARHEGRVAGVVLVKNHWNLCSLFVAPALHGQGLGRRLVEAAAGQCRGRSPKGAIWLNAAPNAVPFYLRLGFVDRAVARALPPGFRALQRPL